MKGESADLIDTLKNGAIDEMYLPVADASGMFFEGLERSNFGHKFRHVGKSGETALPHSFALTGGLTIN
jgi:hypothetical protein